MEGLLDAHLGDVGLSVAAVRATHALAVVVHGTAALLRPHGRQLVGPFDGRAAVAEPLPRQVSGWFDTGFVVGLDPVDAELGQLVAQLGNLGLLWHVKGPLTVDTWG